MLHFENDYNKGAHPELLNALIETNDQGLSGYRTDSYCQQAADKIREVCSCPQAEVEFLVGGTQTNQVVISSMLASYEGVIAAETGHVSSHEAGAIEFSGHKVLTLPSHNGKQAKLQLILRLFMLMVITNTWFFQEWFIYHIQQNMEHFIVKQN